MFQDLVLKNRSYRRFYQNEEVSREALLELIDLARLTPSAMNKQPLKYKIVNDPKTCAEVFPLLGWAGYLADWPGPAEGERPPAYIVVLGDTSLGSSFNMDKGIAAQTILLGAVEKGLGGCFIATVEREKLAPLLDICKDTKSSTSFLSGNRRRRSFLRRSRTATLNTGAMKTAFTTYRNAPSTKLLFK